MSAAVALPPAPVFGTPGVVELLIVVPELEEVPLAFVVGPDAPEVVPLLYMPDGDVSVELEPEVFVVLVEPVEPYVCADATAALLSTNATIAAAVLVANFALVIRIRLLFMLINSSATQQHYNGSA